MFTLRRSKVEWGEVMVCGLQTFYIMRNARKGPLSNLRTTQAQISLRISAGWSGPSLSAYRINGYCRICWQTENAQVRLHGCACWSGPTLSTNCIRAFLCFTHHMVWGGWGEGEGLGWGGHCVLGYISRKYNKYPKILNTLFHSFWPEFCFLCSCFLNYSVEWQTV